MTRAEPSKPDDHLSWRKECRICSGRELKTFLSLGPMPLANHFLSRVELKTSEAFYPLDVNWCPNCSLIQLAQVVEPEVLFSDYPYIPSTSATMVRHFRKLAEEIVSRFKLEKTDLVLDVGSGNGTLLSQFRKAGLCVLGVDPAENLAEIARRRGVETISSLFTSELADRISREKGSTKIISATNVMAHLDDLNDFCLACRQLLGQSGVLVAEFPYLVDLLNKVEFDTIYHEHLSYFSLQPLLKLFKKHRVKIFDARRIPVHGGSIRIFAGPESGNRSVGPNIRQLVQLEKKLKLHRPAIYRQFAHKTKKKAEKLSALIKELHQNGKTIVAYGAPAKGNVLLNYCGLDHRVIKMAVDSIVFKHHRFTPGTHIPIYPEKRFQKNQPDYGLLLAWNFADEILKKQARFRRRGGRFIVPSPQIKIA